MAEAIGALSAWLDNAKRMAKRNWGDLVNSPNDFASVMSARMNEDMTKRLQDPTAALDFVAPASGAVGAILPNGLTRANLLHNLTGSPSKIVKMLKEGRISSPSIAVTERTAYPFAEAPTIVFNPQSTRLDPMLNKANQMYSRDMYSFRNKDIGELPEKIRTGEQDARFTEGLWSKDPSEKFSGLPDDPGKMLAIGASPRMKSFAHWESDPLGYGVLGHFDEAAQSLSDDLADQTGTWLLENRLRVPTGSRGALSALKNAAENGDSEAQRILYGFAKLPSNYAELKIVGDVPLTKDNVSAIMVPEYYDPPGDYLDMMTDLADEAGILMGFPSDILPTKHQATMRDTLNELIDWTKSAQPGVEAPPAVSRYLSPRELTRIHNNPGDVDFLTRQAFVNSPQYNADIAHYLSLEP